ncbi:PREDICTED: putative F-box/LRR-repeat protein At3g18150 [Camelina sativa]|uniref:F-box/LRR-repeat protein At3g18150 n=1 Tax=Camelina sativa TaxID=90675 RepID=A0ABM0X5Y1_CAMSA|nr:PREDICTED: putative F-box/LRR-repeat protein At3g18150 [Camelina sativa]
MENKVNFIKSWVKYAMFRNVENISLEVHDHGYRIPASFFMNSSVKELNVELASSNMVHGCSLTLYCCKGLGFLDLSKMFHLRTLEINSHVESSMNIVAPHIHCLRLINSQLPCTLVDASSLTEAKLDICIRSRDRIFKGDFLQAMVLGMLEKLQHVEKLTFGGNFLQEVFLTKFLISQGLNPEKCWRSKDGVILNRSRQIVASKHVISFIEIMLKNTEKLDKMVIQLDERYLSCKFKDLMIPLLPPNNNVSIALSSKPMILDE